MLADMSDEWRYHELPATVFPFTVTYTDAETDELIRQDVIDGPGVMKVPPFDDRHVSVLMQFADGTIVEQTFS